MRHAEVFVAYSTARTRDCVSTARFFFFFHEDRFMATKKSKATPGQPL